MGQKKNEWNFSEYDFLCFFDIYNHVDISQLKKKIKWEKKHQDPVWKKYRNRVSLAVFQTDNKPCWGWSQVPKQLLHLVFWPYILSRKQIYCYFISRFAFKGVKDL